MDALSNLAKLTTLGHPYHHESRKLVGANGNGKKIRPSVAQPRLDM